MSETIYRWRQSHVLVSWLVTPAGVQRVARCRRGGRREDLAGSLGFGTAVGCSKYFCHSLHLVVFVLFCLLVVSGAVGTQEMPALLAVVRGAIVALMTGNNTCR